MRASRRLWVSRAAACSTAVTLRSSPISRVGDTTELQLGTSLWLLVVGRGFFISSQSHPIRQEVSWTPSSGHPRMPWARGWPTSRRQRCEVTARLKSAAVWPCPPSWPRPWVRRFTRWTPAPVPSAWPGRRPPQTCGGNTAAISGHGPWISGMRPTRRMTWSLSLASFTTLLRRRSCRGSCVTCAPREAGSWWRTGACRICRRGCGLWISRWARHSCETCSSRASSSQSSASAPNADTRTHLLAMLASSLSGPCDVACFAWTD